MKFQTVLNTATSTLAVGAAFLAMPAFAQSTGSVDFDEHEIVVTGAHETDVPVGISNPDSSKARAVISGETVSHLTAGNTVISALNLIPGVSFTNNDPYGNSGGNIRIRGFDGNRISLTWDGIPLNDSGNYAIYTNQTIDPEILDSVNVNFGATDVDSPTASASGGTVNIRTRQPLDEIGGQVAVSIGDNDYHRVFGAIDTGVFTSFGTKAFFSASTTKYDTFHGPGGFDKEQFNGKIYQPLGSNGDFISLAGHLNVNRNNFYYRDSLSDLRGVAGSTVVPASGTADNPIDLGKVGKSYKDALYAVGYADSCSNPNTCSSYYNFSINPSNTANIRFNSRFTLNDKLRLTIDAGYQYVKANGGGTSTYNEATGPFGTAVDLNGDGDTTDTGVRFLFPSNTRTQRLTATASLIYDLDDTNTVRIAYTWDRARHRQTGEAGLLNQTTGDPVSVFGGLENDAAIYDVNGQLVEKRDRRSYAILHQIAGEYRGSFFDDALNVNVGLRAPFFRRNLTNYCYTIPGSSNNAYCASEDSATVLAAHPTYAEPYDNRVVTYSALLPNLGFTYRMTSQVSLFGSYAKGFSAPRTDNLYGFDGVKIGPAINVKPEKTDSFDLGVRFSDSLVQAQLAGWYSYYKNRIITSQVDDGNGGSISADRNVGPVRTYGFDANVGMRPVKQLSLYAFASYIHSELLDDVLNSDGTLNLATGGKEVVETPKWQFGGRAELDVEPVTIGMQVKYTGDRFLTDVNDVKVGSYTIVDLDARVSLKPFGFDRAYAQLNVSNLFNEWYFGSLSTSSSNGGSVYIGAPRTVQATLNFAF